MLDSKHWLRPPFWLAMAAVQSKTYSDENDFPFGPPRVAELVCHARLGKPHAIGCLP